MDTKEKNGRRKGRRHFHHLTADNRTIICFLHKEGKSCSFIAGKIGCNKSTISRELRRNSGQRGYRHKQANEMANMRILEKARNRRKITERIWDDVKALLAKGWSFEQISGRRRMCGDVHFVCRETLYKEYYSRQRLVIAGKSDEDLPALPQRRKKRRRRGAKKYKDAGRGKIPNRRDIDERPKSVESRARAGHWEGDLVNGLRGTGNLGTLVERKSRFTLFGHTPTKETEKVIGLMSGLLSRRAPRLVKTVTFDNGKEFAGHSLLTRRTGADVYFAKPYHSWERGTNENRNRVIRKVLPKGSSFSNITEEEMRKIDYLLNDRPMKCLGWRTPREVFRELESHYRRSRLS